MSVSLRIEKVETADIQPAVRRQIHALCDDAYGENLAQYFTDIGPGVHLLGWHGDHLAAHAMWVPRALYPSSGAPLNSAYVELVATRSREQGRGIGSLMMRQVAESIGDFDIGALSPSRPSFYERLGWENWLGPLLVRTGSGIVHTPDEAIMILRLPGTPTDLDVTGALAVDWRPGEVW